MGEASRASLDSTSAFQVESYMRITRGQSTSVFNHVYHSLLVMGLSTSSISRLQSTGRTVQVAIRGESRRQRYALFPCHVHWLVDPRITAHILCRSTFSVMIPSSLSLSAILLGEDQQDDAFHHFMFGSASRLDCSLVRTNGTPDQCASMSPTAR